MKTLISIAVIIVVILIGIGVWMLFFNHPTNPQPGSTTNPFPTGSSTPMQTGTTLQNNPQVQQALSNQLQDSRYSYSGTVVVMPYALQNWGDENAGNQALLRYDPAAGWTVVNTGGGAWDVPSLESQGVPEQIAEELIAGEN